MWEKHFIQTQRGTFEVFINGVGTPLAVTHLYSAFDERGNHFANAFTEDYQVYLINLRGAGESVGVEKEEQYSMEEAVLDLEAIRETLDFDRWAFAGHSAGGMLGLKYAIVAPAALTKIIVGGAAASREYGYDVESIYSEINPKSARVKEIMNLLSNADTPQEERQKLGYEWALMSYQSEELLKKSLNKPNSGKTVGARLDYFRQVEFPTFDLREELKTVQVPAHVYAGRYDAQCPFKYGVEIAALLSNSTFTKFDESNHFPFVEEQDKFEEFVKSTIGKA